MKHWPTSTVYLLIQPNQEARVFRRRWLAELVAETHGGYVQTLRIIDYLPGFPRKDFIRKRKEHVL
jgi:hypothetical protein